MTTKLTLSIDKEVIKSAKQLSQKNKVSISKMVENFLRESIKEKLPKKLNKKESLPPFLQKMYGIAKNTDKREYREVYREYIAEKYS